MYPSLGNALLFLFVTANDIKVRHRLIEYEPGSVRKSQQNRAQFNYTSILTYFSKLERTGSQYGFAI